MEFTNDNITDFISGMISLGGGDYVEAGPEKFVMMKSGKNHEGVLEDGTTRKFAVYGTTAPNVIVINPFAEGESNSSRENWFYRSRNLWLATLVRKCVLTVLEVGVRAHARKQEEQKDDKKFVKYLGKYAHNCTAKTMEDFKKIAPVAKPTEFFNIYYSKSKCTAEVKCNLFRDSTRKSFPNVTDATWEALQAVMLKVLGVKDLNEFTFKTDSMNIPVLHSFTNVYLQIFDNMHDIMKLVGIENIETDKIRSHLPMLEAYHQRAKWCSSVSSVVSTEEAQKAAPSKSVIPSALGATAPAVWNTGLPAALSQSIQPAAYTPPQALPAALGATNAPVAPLPACMMQQPVMQPQMMQPSMLPSSLAAQQPSLPAVLRMNMF